MNYVFVKDSGSDMPTLCDTSYKFTALWEKTWQQVHFSDQCANIAGLTGTGATDLKQQVGDRVALPMTYHDVDNKGPRLARGMLLARARSTPMPQVMHSP